MGSNAALQTSIQSMMKVRRSSSSLLQDNLLQCHHPHSHSLLSFLTKTSTRQSHIISYNGISSNTTANAISGGGNHSAMLSATDSATASASTALLAELLEAGKFREADEETRRLLIVLAGEAAQKRGYIFFSEVQYIPEAELRAIDQLWLHHSSGKFGYSVQKRIFLSQAKANSDFTRFFIRVGWMKKLTSDSDTADQYNYKSFPSEFFWEISDDVPDGHLPLTNALRGTQLLNSIFAHPAFDHILPDEPQIQTLPNNNATTTTTKPPLFKTNYSF